MVHDGSFQSNHFPAQQFSACFRVLLVLHGQIKMRLARPPLREGDRIGNVEVDRELLHVVAIREEQDAPASNRERAEEGRRASAC